MISGSYAVRRTEDSLAARRVGFENVGVRDDLISAGRRYFPRDMPVERTLREDDYAKRERIGEYGAGQGGAVADLSGSAPEVRYV